MSFCVKGNADLLSVPSSSKVQVKISISGESGARGEAGLSATSQLGEPATGHLLPKHASAPRGPRATHVGNKLWSTSSPYLHELDHFPLCWNPFLALSWSIIPSQLRGHLFQEAFQELTALHASFRLPCLGLILLPLLMAVIRALHFRLWNNGATSSQMGPRLPVLHMVLTEYLFKDEVNKE